MDVAIAVADPVIRVLTLSDYNTRLVVLGTAVLGAAAGLVGVFTLLRRRALMGDAIAHATLPGIATAYLLWRQFAPDGIAKPHGWLLAGATVSGIGGVAAIVLIRRHTRLKQDTALGVVLSVFFGGGVVLLGVIQQLRGGSAAGLESYIYGKTASMTSTDVWWIAVAALIVGGTAVALRKEWTLLCFDEGFAGSRGYQTTWLDFSLMGAVIAVAIVGLQAVGLILIIAMLVIPPAAARFWTDHLGRILVGSTAIGAVSGFVGAMVSALVPDLPSGAMIVLTAATMFAISLCFGPVRGVLPRIARRHRLNRSLDRQHLLRAMYEAQEERTDDVVSFPELLSMRSWSPRRLGTAISRAVGQEWLIRQGSMWQLTRRGFAEARRLTRQHRLWELYLITHADVAPARVDRQADRIEHVVEPEILDQLRRMLGEQSRPMPPSPHADAARPDAPPVVDGGRSDATAVSR